MHNGFRRRVYNKYLYTMKHWLRYLFSTTFLKTAATGIVVVVLAIFGSLYWLKSVTHHGKTVEVPNMKLLQLDRAMAQLDSLGLKYEVIDSTHYVPGIAEGAVVESFPPEYQEVKLGRTIRTILLTTNPATLPKYPLPNYRDQLVSYVTGKFKTKGFLIDSIVMIPDLSHDLVLKVVDDKGLEAEEQQPYPTGSSFTLYVSAGQDGRTVYLPELIGLTYADAQTTLSSFSLNEGALIFADEIEDTAGAFVMRQFPAYDLEVEVGAGSAVDLWLVSDSSKVPVKAPLDTLSIDEFDEF